MNDGLSAEDRDELVRVFRTFPSVQSAVLFGSRAKGTFHPGSDVDLAVRGCSGTEVIALSAVLNEETRLPYFFDVISQETIVSPELLDHIERVGITIYSRGMSSKGSSV